jgi:ethanolamine utilization protein EutQ (cupin superfamily)
MTPMQHKGQISASNLTPMDEFAANAFLDDFAISEDPDKAITAGLFRLEAGESMTYTYTYHEMKLIVDGELHITDCTGETVVGTKGHLFYFPDGCEVTFTTPDFGVGYFVGQRAEGEA